MFFKNEIDDFRLASLVESPMGNTVYEGKPSYINNFSLDGKMPPMPHKYILSPFFGIHSE